MSEQFLASDVSTQETAPTNVNIPSAATNVFGVVGIAERGLIATDVLLQDPADYSRAFGGPTPNNQDAYLAMLAFFAEGGTQMHFIRTVHFTDATDPNTKTSAAASLALESVASAASAGSETSANSGPFVFTNGQTISVKVDAGSAQTTTIAGAAGSAVSGAGTFALTNGWTLIFTVDGGASHTVTFTTGEFATIGAATAAEVVAVLNAFFAGNGIGAVASVASTSHVLITSNKVGSASAVTITGGTAAAALAFVSTGGTGTFANLGVVTAAQLAAAITIAGGSATVVGQAVKLTSGTTGGSSSVQVVAGSTAAAEIGFDNAIHTGNTGAAVETIAVSGLTDGTYANGVQVVISAATSGNAAEFNWQTMVNGVIEESFPNLSMSSTDPRYFVTIINDPNAGSPYVSVVDQDAGVLPAAGTFGPMTGGSDGLAGLNDADFVGGEGVNGDTGLRALDSVLTLSLLAVPGRATPTVHNAMVTYCEITRAGSVFAILDPPKNQTAQGIATYVTATAFLQNLTEYAAIYWPNILVDNPSSAVYGSSPTLVAPPSGSLAGLFSRIDAKTPAGVFVHPAGTDNGQLFTARGFEMPEVKKKSKRDIVFPLGINPISTEPGQPIFVDGAQVLKLNGNFASVGERRGMIFVESSVKTGLAFMRHKNIRARLYADGKKALFKFMYDLCRNDAFNTTDPAQAFSIDLGAGRNPASVRVAKKVFAGLSAATSPPAQWIVVQVSPDTRQLDAELAAATPVAA